MESWWRQWSSGCRWRKRSKFPIYNFELDESSKRIFSVVACFSPSSQLFWTHTSQILKYRVKLIWAWHKSSFIDSMANVECWQEKSPLILDLGPHSHSTEQQAKDCFAVLAISHWFLPNHSLLNLQFPTCCVMFMSNGRWAPKRFIYNLSSLLLFIWQD